LRDTRLFNGPARLRKIIEHGDSPSDEAATKLIWLALRNITADWKRASEQRVEIRR
jgi:hypothetical protein